MRQDATFNILMYSHDTYGLGHLRRTMAVASHLQGPAVNILILTGSPIAGQFVFPPQIDFVRIPGMIKMTNNEYLPLSIKINPTHALNIRKNIITATAKTFKPHLFIVDKEPLGLKKEVLPTLRWLRRNLPETRTILGLRDIMDDAQTVRNDWKEKGVYDVLDQLYSEIWVYGIQDFYDPIVEYDIPEAVRPKIYFTGYIPRKLPGKVAMHKIRKKIGVKKDQKLVVVTAGGGGDGYVIMDTFLSMLETRPLPFKSVLISGPFMPKKERDGIFERARQLNVKTWQFYSEMEEILAAADLVVSMGGYNTLCEVLTQKTLALIIPRENPRQEQLIRARVFSSRKLAEYISWPTFSPEILRDKILALLEHPEPYQDAISGFQLTAMDRIQKRLYSFCSKA
ncbi:MAG: glycosyltransferase [Desulfobacterales bacterium]|nr:glycosyltransferase [Desulfobacterales bacterium]